MGMEIDEGKRVRISQKRVYEAQAAIIVRGMTRKESRRQMRWFRFNRTSLENRKNGRIAQRKQQCPRGKYLTLAEQDSLRRRVVSQTK